jgi:hypothetical protein
MLIRNYKHEKTNDCKNTYCGSLIKIASPALRDRNDRTFKI